MSIANIKENINQLGDTQALEELLFAMIYWIAVVVVILFIFYVCVKINNKVKEYKSKKSRKNKDDFLD